MQQASDDETLNQADHTQAPAHPVQVPSRSSRLKVSQYSDLLYLLELLDNQISLADSKAHLVLGANAILLATWEIKQGVMRDVLAGNIPILEGSSVIFELLMMALVLISGIYALRSTLPRIIYGSSTPNPFFFGHIHRMSEDDYIEMFRTQSAQDAERNILLQIHAKSRIVHRKFLLLRVSMFALTGAFGFWMLSQFANALGK